MILNIKTQINTLLTKEMVVHSECSVFVIGQTIIIVYLSYIKQPLFINNLISIILKITFKFLYIKTFQIKTPSDLNKNLLK